MAAPDLALAELSVAATQAAFVAGPEGRHVFGTEAGAPGYAAQGARPYPVYAATTADLGQIGGVGMRLYFELLRALTALFGAMALLNTPALLLNYRGLISPGR